MPVTTRDLEKAIHSALPVTHLEIKDESDGCGEKYSIFLVSETFEGKSTLARHRLVNDMLKSQITQMHAFSQKTMTPQQYEEYLAQTNNDNNNN